MPLKISEEAQIRILSILNDYKKKQNAENAIPFISWIDSSLNGNAVKSGPIIGFYRNARDAGDPIYDCGRFRYILLLPDDALELFENRTLHVGDSDEFTLV